MTLPLITPIGSNFLKDFPGQHAVNVDLIDTAAGPCLRTQPMQAYTPTLTAVTTAPTLGATGFIKGFYYKIFDQIYCWGEFRFKTGFSVGSGIYIVSLPFAVSGNLAPNTNIGAAPILGNGFIWSQVTTASRQPVAAQLRTSTDLMFGVKMNNLTAREVSHNNPYTWAVDDGLSWCVRYKRIS